MSKPSSSGIERPFQTLDPRIISDNGPQFIARDFKEFIRLSGMTHVKTSPYHPQSNGVAIFKLAAQNTLWQW